MLGTVATGYCEWKLGRISHKKDTFRFFWTPQMSGSMNHEKSFKYHFFHIVFKSKCHLKCYLKIKFPDFYKKKKLWNIL